MIEDRLSGSSPTFDDETYRKLFNGFVVDPTSLQVTSDKPVVQMTDEELMIWIHKLDDFIRVTKLAQQASRVNLEDRKLKYTTEQREALERLDRKYKPATLDESKLRKIKQAKVKEPELKPKNEWEKRVFAAMKILEMTREAAEVWVTAQGIKEPVPEPVLEEDDKK